ncbi:hypothetical protein JX265_003613 [Neoarthrinium moseri]|uniref:Uncharacterized protein n=1 Tax=Neoarthrinium moseri TaxID=1658444 RepID=A0A9P9WS67_9PEZI|nr:hypothetical protein JX266_001204 [Neoarthrinium moseri]KAI1877605.1 hypothetical protein JX265_003613 [Neoarthrinium moseri]
MAIQKSLLEYLTAKNPDIDNREPADKKNTSRNSYFVPKQLIEWTEFSFQTLQAVYEGQLIEKAREKDTPLPDYPFCVPDVDCVVDCEPATVHIMTKWNHGIVTPALDAVRDTFHPCMWIPRPMKKDIKKGNGTKGKKSNSNAVSRRLKGADGGAMSSWPSHEATTGEMLPKDYKTYTKWDSRNAINQKMLHKDGTWRRGMSKKNNAMPIRQVYTYCVNFGCRYGCILSTGEAFIFRIRPRAPTNNLSPEGSSSDQIIRQQLIKDGLLEYVSIPWDNNNGGNPEDYKSLTVNLGLWFIHVLAGNHYRVGWEYPPLENEALLTKPPAATAEPVTPASEPRIQPRQSSKKRSRFFNNVSTPTKRRRSERLKDSPGYSVSFSTELPFQIESDHDSSNESTTDDTEQSSASDTEC